MNAAHETLSNLSLDQKRALLAELLEQKAASGESATLASYGQQSLWFLNQLAPESWAYNALFSARIRSTVDVAALRQACAALVERHPTLRTTYALSGGRLIQQVHQQ